jgi:hypothetical protein
MVDHVYKVESQYLDEKAGVFPLSTGVKNLGSVTVIFFDCLGRFAKVSV